MPLIQSYQGRQILTMQENGQCAGCGERVLRVLVPNLGWKAAELGHYNYQPHRCGESEPLRPEAA